MLDVLIVDDEPFIRGVLCELISWEEQGMALCGDTYNGEEALGIMKRRNVDILITDIKMPVMDGLELIPRARKLNPQLRIVVLSAYDDYPLVREAFRAGADDYLLKPELTDDGLTDVLTRIRSKHKASRESSFSPDARSACLLRVLRTGSVTNKDRRTLIGADADGNRQLMQMAVIRLCTGASRLDDVREGLKHIIERAGEDGRCVYCVTDWDRICLFCPSHGTSGVIGIEELISNLSDRHSSLDSYTGVSVSSCGMEDIGTLYRQALVAMSYAFLAEKGDVVEYGRIANRTDVLEEAEAKAGMLREALRSWNPQAIKETTGRLEIPKRLYRADQADPIREQFNRYRLIIGEFLHEKGLDGFLVEQLRHYDETLRHSGRLTALNVWTRDIFEAYAAKISDANLIAGRTAHLLGKRFKMDDSLDEMAEMLGISRGHLCRTFREAHGKSVMQYRERLRIDESVRLLRSGNLRVYEIAEQVGYANVEHFSKVFKKLMGVSPKRFLKGEKGSYKFSSPR